MSEKRETTPGARPQSEVANMSVKVSAAWMAVLISVITVLGGMLWKAGQDRASFVAALGELSKLGIDHEQRIRFAEAERRDFRLKQMEIATDVNWIRIYLEAGSKTLTKAPMTGTDKP